MGTSTIPTYKEVVYRYRLLRHDDLPEEHKAAYRQRGIDPDDLWSLVWSFRDEETAVRLLEEERKRAASFQTWKLVDAGADEVIERQAW